MTELGPTEMSEKKGVHALVTAAAHFGVRDVILCPGSRNAPLIISFRRCGLFRCHSIADERVAAFYALGMALASGRPVAVACTSGSAAVNFGPGLVEAYYLKAPVVAITADRPADRTDQGDGQTIRQEGLFANFIRASYSVIAEPVTAGEAGMNRRKISEVFNRMLTATPGPVHFNVPMNEPLYRTEFYPPESVPRFYTRARLSAKADKELVLHCASEISAADKVMVLIGQSLHDPELDREIEAWSAMPNVAVLTETTANIYAGEALTTIDRIIMSVRSPEVLKTLMPDVLITAGGMIVSKKIKALLSAHHPRAHWHVNPHDEGLDTFRSLTDEVPAAPAEFLRAVRSRIKTSSATGYAARMKVFKQAAQAAHDTYTEALPWSDFAAFRIILKHIPRGTAFHMANSSAVRYVQLFGTAKGVFYHANRGTSGIDGSTSTAAGWASARPEQDTLLVTGDTAFIYDSNALWNRALPRNLKIIVINNGGGGIFRIIDGPSEIEELEPFFEADHPVSIKGLADAFGVQYFSASETKAAEEKIANFFAAEGCAILELATPKVENPGILKKYFKHIAAAFRTHGLLETKEKRES